MKNIYSKLIAMFSVKQVAAQEVAPALDNVVSLDSRRQEKLASRRQQLPADIRNLRVILEAVKDAEAEASVKSTLETGSQLNNLYVALLCQVEAVLENAEARAATPVAANSERKAA